MRKTKTSISRAKSYNKIAEFWDTHDITDFEDLLEEVAEPVFRRGKKIHVHLEQDEFESVEKLARQRGLKKDDLIHEWIREKLDAA